MVSVAQKILRMAYKPSESVAELIKSVKGADIFEIENKDGRVFINGTPWEKESRLETFKSIEEKIDKAIEDNELPDYSPEAIDHLKSVFKDGAFQFCNEAAFKDSTKDFGVAKSIKPGMKAKISMTDLASLLSKEAGTSSAVDRLKRQLDKEIKKVAKIMKPSEVSIKLRQIATAIDNSSNPKRNLVIADLKAVIAAIDPDIKSLIQQAFWTRELIRAFSEARQANPGASYNLTAIEQAMYRSLDAVIEAVNEAQGKDETV